MGVGELTVTVGVGVTVIVTVAVPLHPLLVPVTVYVVVTDGNAVTINPTVLLKPVAGAHVYVFAPLAVIVKLSPVHRLEDGGVNVIVGVGFTVTSTVAVLTHAPAVPVTVYIVVTVGLAVTVAPTVALNPVAGLQL